ncbi:hypothetical protein [Nocardiopsis alborubida]|uniref:Uncharacterized protein n=1 Tax=Nocardiopsis alborubida TaxID=146802 RepID=A0A7X6M9E5_9ACTN|nr:hypothetical protein [Nocardiopsis alborubida]NKY96572.1 hypothetical protein [Nocardiopsis alborubida]
MPGPICLNCLDHPGRAADAPRAREEPTDRCRACLGSGRDQRCPPVPEGFWAQVDHQLARIRDQRVSTFDQVRAVLLDECYDAVIAEVNRNFVRRFSIDQAFFAGSGGESLIEALSEAGWKMTAVEASYHYVMAHPGADEMLTYIEGDLERGGAMLRG